jgi:predicted ATPase
MEQLNQALEQAKAGHGQIVGTMGEPGLGKSRLFYEFVGAYCHTPLQDRLLVLQASSVSYGKASSYLPVIELLKTYFQIQPQDDERTRREKVIGKVLGLERTLEDTLQYLFTLLGVEDSTSSLQQMDPQIRRKRTFDALKRTLLRESLNQPLILIFEDLHWIDSETQGFLDTLSDSVASARILLLTNYRPEYRHEWGTKTYYTQLRLAPFGKEEAEKFLTLLLGEKGFPSARRGSPDPAGGVDRRSPVQLVARSGDRPQPIDPSLHALKQLILEKTEGTPFFMEEVVQELFEQGVLVRDSVGARRAVPLPADLHIPTTVQGVLAARIDRLALDEKTLLQQLAVIGREFPLSLVKHVIAHPEDELYRLLASLQHKEFLYEQPAFPEVEYLFKHALTQEVAYNSVLIEQRKALHERTAQAMESLYSTKLEDHYSELAHHYSRSGNTQKAVEYLQLAGQQAVQRSANVEAISHLTHALALLETLSDTPERTQQELSLQMTLGPVLMATKGYAASEVGTAYTRARELCQQIGKIPQLFPVLFGLWVFHTVRAEHEKARELAGLLLSLAQSAQDSALLLEAHHALGQTFFFLGELAPARIHLEQGITLYDLHQHHSLAFLYGAGDPGVFCQGFVAFALWLLGYPDQALKKSHEALVLAQELSHPHSLASTLTHGAMLHYLRREVQATQERVEVLITLSHEQGFPFWLAVGLTWQGWVLAEQGQEEEGITQIHQGRAAIRATGARQGEPHGAALLAGAYGKMGKAEEGLNALAEALAAVDKTGERWYEAELYRLRGELTLVQSKASLGQVSDKFQTSQEKSEDPNPQPLTFNMRVEVEECFLKAIAVARRQQAKSLELRAVMSLVRLRQQQAQEHASRNTHHASSNTDHASRSRLDEAHQMLSEIYNWFIEGFDTKDLQEAKALLAELT